MVLLDGRSGSGKTTLGAALASALDAELVGLDDVYPGWDGLAAASLTVSSSILRAESPGYRRWDWDHSRQTDWRAVDARAPLVVEGAGALTPASARLATLRLWIELDAPARHTRVLGRGDGDSYGATDLWDRWAAQEDEHLRLHRPDALADVVL
ncbi:AAA family ATPase [Frondihabitans cladoniiphilus]|uniref:AAA family ATPase n=1 Tax=Frondihabitans cladoniiphilus TaxID=715785 RepID=A0ABP8VT76_9MICO